MAKTKYRRYHRTKGRWSANIRNIEDFKENVPAGVSGNSIDLCLNPVQSDNSVSQQFTVKNIELSVVGETGSGSSMDLIENLEHYIMYVPQGMNLTTDYNLEHPEYIMAYYYQGSPNNNQQPQGFSLKLKSRLARRLQTGDKIVYFYKFNNTAIGQIQGAALRIGGLVRWWTKAN